MRLEILQLSDGAEKCQKGTLWAFSTTIVGLLKIVLINTLFNMFSNFFLQFLTPYIMYYVLLLFYFTISDFDSWNSG